MDENTIKVMIEKAMDARKNSYSPYSDFQVGACLLDENGEMYLGCNIENAGYTATNCAERTAFFNAVSKGVRGFRAIAVVGGKKDAKVLEECPPCGVCRQVMMEFCNPETFEIITASTTQNYHKYKLSELLPFGFGPSQLERG